MTHLQHRDRFVATLPCWGVIEHVVHQAQRTILVAAADSGGEAVRGLRSPSRPEPCRWRICGCNLLVSTGKHGAYTR